MKGDKKERERLELVEAFESFLVKASRLTLPVYLGIDPGQEGAIGFVCGSGYAVLDIPTTEVVKNKKKRKEYQHQTILDYFQLFAEYIGWNRVLILLEEIPISTGPGRKYADVVVNRGYAMWHLFLLSRKYKLREEAPNKWKKACHLPPDKEVCLLRARKLFPDAPLSRVQDHNRAEALLLTDYNRRTA